MPKLTILSILVGEKDYRNSSKIVHGFGPSGLAPLTPLSNREKKIPIIIVWPHPGKVVHLTGTFNNWKKKIRLQKRYLIFSIQLATIRYHPTCYISLFIQLDIISQLHIIHRA